MFFAEVDEYVGVGHTVEQAYGSLMEVVEANNSTIPQIGQVTFYEGTKISAKLVPVYD